ncbi:MAG TPA: nicotinate-nucleotide adenylyltransferase [Rhodocyclaceae bacterium]|nr:nicotinate-nucleotide adenylyltransferase [Rhodocyclaceae bacterium]
MSNAGGGPLGILGGTFDPIHCGHLRLAEEALERLQLARVRLIPAGMPPHRNPPVAAADQRLAMARLVVAHNHGLELDASEVAATGPSYTVPTLERLRGELGEERPLVLLMGADAFLGLTTWHRWEDMFRLAHIAVATRPSHSLEAAHMAPELAQVFSQRLARTTQALTASPAGAIVPFGITPLDISATAIRAALATGRSARYLLPDEVLDYISSHHLYQSPTPETP